MSADGKISSFEGSQVRISGPQDRKRVDMLRAESDAIMVGVGTVLADDPSLRIRDEGLRQRRKGTGRSENPLRVVVDSTARTPTHSQVLGEGCILAVSGRAPRQNVEPLKSKCQLLVAGEDRVDLRVLLAHLHSMGVRRLMVEGGGTLNWSLLAAGLLDQICTFVGPLLIGGATAPTPVDGHGFPSCFPQLKLENLVRLDGGVLLRWKVLAPDGSQAQVTIDSKDDWG